MVDAIISNSVNKNYNKIVEVKDDTTTLKADTTTIKDDTKYISSTAVGTPTSGSIADKVNNIKTKKRVYTLWVSGWNGYNVSEVGNVTDSDPAYDVSKLFKNLYYVKNGTVFTVSDSDALNTWIDKKSLGTFKNPKENQFRNITFSTRLDKSSDGKLYIRLKVVEGSNTYYVPNSTGYTTWNCPGGNPYGAARTAYNTLFLSPGNDITITIQTKRTASITSRDLKSFNIALTNIVTNNTDFSSIISDFDEFRLVSLKTINPDTTTGVSSKYLKYNDDSHSFLQFYDSSVTRLDYNFSLTDVTNLKLIGFQPSTGSGGSNDNEDYVIFEGINYE